MRGTYVFLCLCGFGVIASAHYCDRSDGGMPAYGDKCNPGRTRCSKGLCYGTLSEHSNASECSGRCLCGRDNRRCLQSLVDVDVKPVPPENPSRLVVNYTIHENHGTVKLRRLCFKHFTFTDVGARVLNQDCSQDLSRLSPFPEPGKGYVLDFIFNSLLEGIVIPIEKTFSRPALPKNIKIFTDVEGIPTVTWEQVGDVKSSKCKLKGLDQGNHQVRGHKNYCQFLDLPALVPFQNVTIQVSNHEADQVTKEHRLDAPYVFVPRVVKEVKVKEVGVSHVDFSVTESLVGGDVNVGFYVINGTRVGCGAVQINPTCSKPEELDRCQLRVSRVSLSTITPSEAANTSTAATNTTAATMMMMPTTMATGPQPTERDGEPATEDGGVIILRVEGLDAATDYDIQLTPWFCDVTDWQGYNSPVSVSTLVVAESVTAVCEGGTQVLVSWQTPPATETIHYTVFLTDTTLGTQAETRGTQCSNPSSHEAANQTELCNVSYNPGASNGMCRGFAPDAFWEYGVAVEGRTEHGCMRVTSTSNVITNPTTPGRVHSLKWWTKKNDSRCGDSLLNDHYKLCLKWRDPSPRQQRNYIHAYIFRLAQGQKLIKTKNRLSHFPYMKPSDKHKVPGQGLQPYYIIIGVTPGEEYTITVFGIGNMIGEMTTIVVEIPDVHRPDLSQGDVAQLLLDDSVQKTDTTIEFKVTNTLFLGSGEDGGNITGRGFIVTAGGNRPLKYHAIEDFQRYPSWSNRREALKSHGYRVEAAELQTPSAQPVRVKIGGGSCEKETYCNGPLEKGKDYTIWMFVCNEEDCAQVMLLNETTSSVPDSDKSLKQLQTVVLVVSFCALVACCVYLAWHFRFCSKILSRARQTPAHAASGTSPITPDCGSTGTTAV